MLTPLFRQDSANCCSGSHNTAETCPPDGVQYYDYFKNACKNSYVYAYDESSKTALWTCPTADKAGEWFCSTSLDDIPDFSRRLHRHLLPLSGRLLTPSRQKDHWGERSHALSIPSAYKLLVLFMKESCCDLL